ncbi:hypothetical protein REC12_17760 [Desulfosporosinus sp. PR]|uniref:hypothetical protein n=1 Tax=Candidatus Desulfosporosinus nitrosoreducens TaxID=3401928 RepID=UPI0027EB701A|nr:hypothetical protein [Desulfosporosinus sp. PR]MDQ7095440.1 hypothetical protein [Desulfosporosinus sp. PR]
MISNFASYKPDFPNSVTVDATGKYNLTKIFGKLNVHSRSEAIYEAKRLGLIPNGDFI